MTTSRANQTTGLTNGRATNWAPEVVFSPLRALSRCQLTFPSRCLISLIINMTPKCNKNNGNIPLVIINYFVYFFKDPFGTYTLTQNVDSNKCNHNCDPVASCVCHLTSGSYECLCPKGYEGSGLLRVTVSPKGTVVIKARALWNLGTPCR